MDLKALQLSLLPWLRVGTWHTGHPKDHERFHQAIHTAFSELGLSISYEQFYDAIHKNLAEISPGAEVVFTNEIEEFARRAEMIGSYLFDVRGFE